MGTAGTTGTDGTRAAGHHRSGSGLDARADLMVRVPRGHRVAVYLAVGSVAVANVEGELTIDTHEAEVTANGAKGGLSIDVGSGTVRATQIGRGPERGYRLGQRRGVPRPRPVAVDRHRLGRRDGQRSRGGPSCRSTRARA